MGEKPMTAEMWFAENLKIFKQGLLKLSKESPEVQKAFFEKLSDEFKKMSRDDQETCASILHSLTNELFPEEVC